MKKWKQTRQSKYKARKPYVRLLEYARRRCSDQDPGGPNYHHYAAKGIKCDLTLNELAAVWERDKGWLLKRPSLDRIRSEDNYTMFNVRIREFNLNVRAPHDKKAQAEMDAVVEFA
jgi:hypothetical protein